MKKLVVCNLPDRLQKLLRNNRGPFRFLTFLGTDDGHGMAHLVRKTPGAEEVPKARLFRERSERFRKNYVDCMGRVNASNHRLDWWALPFTNKNPISTPLCRDTAQFLLIRELVQEESSPLLVLSNSPDLAAQLVTWTRQEGIEYEHLFKAPHPWRRLLKLNTPAGILRASFRTFLLWWIGRRFRPIPNKDQDHLVIATLTHPRSFLEGGGYRDAYFGTLVREVSSTRFKPLVLANLVERPFQQLKKFRSVQADVPVAPLESLLTFASLLACTLKAFAIYLRPAPVRGVFEIDGADIGCLVERAVREARHSGDLFLNLRMYYSARRLGQIIRISRCVYPFENRSWEKMLVLGLRDSPSQAQIVGYQHASLTSSHTNFMLGEGEAEITPLPDRILTTGKVATDWLEQVGNYPANMFSTACALRQAEPERRNPEHSAAETARVLVALATNLEEYVNILSFLESAFSDLEGYDVRIRPHPEIPLESALEIAPPKNREFFGQSTGTLSADLQWANVVLYASSTVGLEAVSSGIPAVYLNLGGFLDTDPMAGWNEFKWSVEEPSGLAKTIDRIMDMSASEYQVRQEKGRDYAAAYLTPVTPDSIRTFWES